MKKRIISLLLTSTMLATMVVGCGSKKEETVAPVEEEKVVEKLTTAEVPLAEEIQSAEESEGSEEEMVFGFTCMSGTNPFFVTVEDSIREVVEENGDTLISMDPALDSSTQIDQIEDMISRGIDVMFLNPVDADGVLPALDMLKEAGIPVFGFDASVADPSYLVSFAGSDNYNAGYVCGKDLVEKCPDGGDILVLDHPTAQSVVERTEGFLAAVNESGVAINIVGQQDCQGNQQLANEKATDLLTAHPDVVAIFAANDPAALGAYAAADAAGLSPMIYGVDGSPDIKALLKDTMVEGTGAQSPVTIGRTIATTAYDWLAGENVEANIPIETFLITADNVDDYGTEGWQ